MYIELIQQKNKFVKIGPIKGFSLEKTLECGQCFRVSKTANETYILIAYNRVIEVSQMEDYLYIKNTSIEDVENIWIHYFDLERNYDRIYSEIRDNKQMEDVVDYSYGIHVLNQELIEVITAFVLSSRNTISGVATMLNRLCENYGEKIYYNGMCFYGFPSLEILCSLEVDDFIELKFGYRAKYFEGIFENLIMHSGTYDREYFLSLKGIGNKIADCVLLYGGIDISAFPIDIWITRVLEVKFGYSSSKYMELSTLGREMFGRNAGIAEILLFYYAQTQKIGKVDKNVNIN